MNTSATGGPLLPIEGSPEPLEGKALLVFLQNWVRDICGLAGDMVRPRWQPEPPNIPDAGEAWAAIGVNARPADEFPQLIQGEYTAEGQDPVPASILTQHEDLELVCSFYDLGSTGLADRYAAVLRQGIAVDQNLEYLTQSDFGFVSCSPATPAPTLIKSRWNYRVDMTIGLRRAITRYYPVLTVEEAQAVLYAGTPGGAVLTRTITA